nr:glycoside hydrolase family 130 protein [Porphyrobacter sp. GA68]
MEILPERLEADPSRVVLRPFHLGWQAQTATGGRAERLVQDVLSLDPATAEREFRCVLADFGERHWQTEQLFLRRFEEVRQQVAIDADTLTFPQRALIGAYFCHEYTYAAAALMNPSIVPHPDQSGMVGGSLRFVMSMRAVGEGHISSVAFREGVVARDGSLSLWPQSHFATAANGTEAKPEGEGAVRIFRDSESTLSNTVIFPVTEQQRGGLEDLRLVRFDHGDGDYEWIGTYTAYSGTSIRSELLLTRDFRAFDLVPMQGAGARNKGMALFPKKFGDDYLMVGRQDGKNLFLLRSARLDQWNEEGTLLLEPKFPWEFVQIGNCGSPLWTERGWLLLTHGVGPMRKYALGCALLDLDDPSKVIARSTEPLLTAQDDDRHGYVPNVVYTCGGIIVADETLMLPYGISDSAIGFARVPLERIFSEVLA